jgi:periplasmic protein TonB
MGGSNMLVDPRHRRESQLVIASLVASAAIHAAAFGLVPQIGTDPGDPPAPLSVFLRAAPRSAAVPEEKFAVSHPADAVAPVVPRDRRIAPHEMRVAPLRSEAIRAHRKTVLAMVPAAPPAARQATASGTELAAEPMHHERLPQGRAPAAATAISVANARDAAPEAVTPPAFQAEYLRNPAPSYPLRARRDGIEGTVMLKVLVTAAGAPGRIELQASSGSDALDRAAEDAVRSWRFVPARRGRAAIDAWVVVPVEFHLESG